MSLSIREAFSWLNILKARLFMEMYHTIITSSLIVAFRQWQSYVVFKLLTQYASYAIIISDIIIIWAQMVEVIDIVGDF